MYDYPLYADYGDEYGSMANGDMWTIRSEYEWNQLSTMKKDIEGVKILVLSFDGLSEERKNVTPDNKTQFISRMKNLSVLNSPCLSSMHSLSRLEYLTELVIHGSILTLSNLHDISYITQLEILELKNCDIIYGLKPLCGLKKLAQLSITGCSQLGLDHISDISEMKSISYLDLSETSITSFGCYPIEPLQSMESLRSIQLSMCHIDKKKLEHVGLLTSITSLGISSNRIDAYSLHSLGSISHITELDISSNHIGNEGMLIVSKMVSLTWLDVSSNHIEGDGFASISSMVNLNYLFAGSNDIKAVGAHYISKTTSLVLLSLPSCSIDDKAIEILSKIKSLRKLDISNNKISSKGARFILDMKLISIDFSHNNIDKKTANDIKEKIK